MADLEKAGGFPRGVIYHHIKSKEQLLYEIIIALIRRINSEFAAVLDSSIPPDKKFRDAARILINHAATNRHEMAVFYREWIWLTGEYHDEVVAALDWYEEGFGLILRDGEAAGQFTHVDPVTAKGILSLFNQTHAWVRPDGPLSANEIADRLSEMVLHGISSS
jgi:AcrR family transcriptional regulator